MRFSLRNIVVVLLLFIGFLTFTGAFFIVNETKQAIVLQFGDPRKLSLSQVYNSKFLLFKMLSF